MGKGRRLDKAVCGLRSAVCGLRSAVCGLRSAVCGLRSAVCGLRSAVCGLRSAVCNNVYAIFRTVKVLPVPKRARRPGRIVDRRHGRPSGQQTGHGRESHSHWGVLQQRKPVPSSRSARREIATPCAGLTPEVTGDGHRTRVQRWGKFCKNIGIKEAAEGWGRVSRGGEARAVAGPFGWLASSRAAGWAGRDEWHANPAGL